MKLSCLPFKRLTFFSSSTSLLLLLLLCGCYSVHLLKKTSPPPQQDFFPAVTYIDEHGVDVASVSELSCDTLSPLRLQVKLHSTPHVFRPTFVVHANNTLHMEIDGLVITASQVVLPDYLQLRQTLCRAVARRGSLFYGTADDMLLATLSTWLQALSPPCQIKLRPAHGFYCELRAPAPQSERKMLELTKRRMIRTWQRHPYLLTRRLAIAIDLAQIIVEGKVQRLTRFCHVLRNSFVRELPLIFTSKRWQQRVCDTQEARFKHAALGLELAVREIMLFTQLFERVSHRGNVAVRIAAPLSHRFWVRLTPTADTRAATVQHYQQVLAAREQSRATQGCWHPFFSESIRLHNLAQAIGLHAGHCAAVHYPQLPATASNDFFGNYLVTSITSETEFAISNGRSKFLRLPPGTYDYRISPLPNYYLPAARAEVASGSMQWHKQRRNHQVLR